MSLNEIYERERQFPHLKEERLAREKAEEERVQQARMMHSQNSGGVLLATQVANLQTELNLRDSEINLLKTSVRDSIKMTQDAQAAAEVANSNYARLETMVQSLQNLCDSLVAQLSSNQEILKLNDQRYELAKEKFEQELVQQEQQQAEAKAEDIKKVKPVTTPKKSVAKTKSKATSKVGKH